MKVLFVTTSCATVFLIFNKFKATYDSNHDTFRIEFAILPTVVLALVANYAFTMLEVR
jgi:ER lumen protein retaining receptor